MTRVLKALNNNIKLNKFLKKWNILDKNHAQIFILLIHYYKFKLVEDTSENMTIDIFNKHDSEELYFENKPLFFNMFFEKLMEVLKQLEKKNHLAIYDSILIEVIGKLYFYFFSTMSELLAHESFTLSIERQSHWLNELCSIDKRVVKINKRIFKQVITKMKTLNVCLHYSYTKRKIAEMRDSIFERISGIVSNDLTTYLDENKEGEIHLNTIYDTILNKFQDEVKIEPVMKIERSRQIIESLLVTTVLYIANNFDTSNCDIMDKFQQEMDKFIKEFNDEEKDNQIMFIDLFFVFLNSKSKTKALNALSCISGLLNRKLTRRELTDIINGKQYTNSADKNFFFNCVYQHFKKTDRLNKTLRNKARFSGKVRVTTICMEFLFKLRNASLFKSKIVFWKEPQSKVEEENPFNNPIDYSQHPKLDSLRIKYAFFTGKYMKSDNKGKLLEEM